ncbi:DUF4298 domain-containing protein [Fusobacterium sp.]|uniref:DUF4298 domain-containing protein n=1 Tax=Fusobacterium sp. TaxID=68766 RepID=UPI0026352AAA|nr:DUF4298 domain-containing protein [Fusobacterium sp.]
MKEIDTAIERIKYFESIYDEVSQNIESLKNNLDQYEESLSKLKELKDYYNSSKYMEDYTLDEKGMIPKDLKRGILSEDSIDDLLIESIELEERLKNLK